MRRNQKGFTLMELMVVIVIVAILAAVAVPLYINYVKDARRTEAKAAIGALATAMEEYYLKTGSYNLTTTDGSDLYATNADGVRNSNLSQETLQEIQTHWTINIVGNGTTDYTITLNGAQTASGYQDVGVIYTYTRGQGAKFQDTEGSGGS